MTFEGNPLLERGGCYTQVDPNWSTYRMGMWERSRRGSMGYPELHPRLANIEMRGKDLCYQTFIHNDQKQIVRAFTLADGRCPVLGCEDAVHKGPRGLIASGQNWMRDDQGYLTGAGIIPGYGYRENLCTMTIRPNDTAL